jgi:hypothetical protein
VIGGSVSVLTNGEESNTFKTGKGLRQGDPLSPLLFNFVGDVLNRMLWKAARGLIAGLLQQFRPGGLLLCSMQTTPFYSLLMNPPYLRT